MTIKKKDLLLVATGMVVFSGVNTVLKNEILVVLPDDLSASKRVCVFVSRVILSLYVSDKAMTYMVPLFKSVEKGVEDIKAAFVGDTGSVDTL